MLFRKSNFGEPAKSGGAGQEIEKEHDCRGYH